MRYEGSGFVDHSQKLTLTLTASAMAEKKTVIPRLFD